MPLRLRRGLAWNRRGRRRGQEGKLRPYGPGAVEMRYWRLGATLVLVVLLDWGLGAYLQIGRVRPDLLTVVTVAVGLLFGRRYGMAVGFALGVLQGLEGRYLGAFAFSKTLVGYAGGAARRTLFVDSLLVGAAVVGVLSLVADGVFWALTGPAPATQMAVVVAGRALYHALLAPLALLALRGRRGQEAGP